MTWAARLHGYEGACRNEAGVSGGTVFTDTRVLAAPKRAYWGGAAALRYAEKPHPGGKGAGGDSAAADPAAR